MTRLVLNSTAASGHANKRTPTSPSATVAGVGCSGSDPIWSNGGIAWLVQQATGTLPSFAKSTTPGAPIGWHRTNPPAFGPAVWPNMGLYSCIHLGDNPNLDNLQDGVILNEWAQKFWTEGNGGAGGEILLWSLQPILQSTPTAQRNWFNSAVSKYDAAQDYVNARRPGTQPLLRQIPGLQLFQRFFEDQEAGLAPGASATWFRDLYTDTFHMVGGKIAYMASVIGAACMYGIDPKTMPNDMQTASGFTVSEAQYVKARVSDVVKAFDRSGVNTTGWLA